MTQEMNFQQPGIMFRIKNASLCIDIESITLYMCFCVIAIIMRKKVQIANYKLKLL